MTPSHGPSSEPPTPALPSPARGGRGVPLSSTLPTTHTHTLDGPSLCRRLIEFADSADTPAHTHTRVAPTAPRGTRASGVRVGVHENAHHRQSSVPVTNIRRSRPRAQPPRTSFPVSRRISFRYVSRAPAGHGHAPRHARASGGYKRKEEKNNCLKKKGKKKFKKKPPTTDDDQISTYAYHIARVFPTDPTRERSDDDRPSV